MGFAFAVVCVFAAYNLLRPAPLVLEFDAQINTSPAGQIFYSRDGSYSEDRSQLFDIYNDGNRHVYRVEIEGKLPYSVRLDLGSAPGQIILYRLSFKRGGRDVSFGPDGLVSAIQPLGGVEMERPQGGLPIASLDEDPHFSLAVPSVLRMPTRADLVLGILLLMTLAGLTWISRWRIRAAVVTVGMIRPIVLWPVIGVLGTLLILRVAGISFIGDRPLQSLVAGSGLMLAVLAFAALGRCAQQVFSRKDAVTALGLPVNVIIGQAALFLYVYLRSLPGAIGLPIPITGYEILALVLGSGIFLLRQGRQASLLPANLGITAFQVAVVYLLCLVVADRELPRLVMLSSDPDVHAFLARQVMHFGGVPWQQGVWGEDGFNYPAGTGVLIASWAWISKLDVRDAASALSFITYSLAALALADAVSKRAHGGFQVLAALLAMALLFTAYMLPLHGSFVHMEGLGRVVAFEFLAGLAALVLAACRQDLSPLRASLMSGLLVFVLACLNPINLAAAGLIVGLGFIWLLTGRRWVAAGALLASLFVIVLVAVDPYFFGMLLGQAPIEKVVLEGFGEVQVAEGLRQGLSQLGARPLFFVGSAIEVIPGASRLASILLVSGLAVAWACVIHRKDLWRLVGCAVAFLAVMAATLAISQQFSADRRFFLLAPYLPISLAQVKILLVVLLSIVITLRVAMRRRLAAAGILSILVVLGSASIIRPGANFFLAPKRDYCGGVECPAPDDVIVLEKFREYYVREGIDPEQSEDRLLIANKVIRMGGELWLFPAGGGRLAPHSGVGPVAFFYYQGDPDYTTRNYVANVCERFNLAWLREQKVRYLLLPASPGDWCIHGHENLALRWETVAYSGNARVIDLTREKNDP